MIAVYVAGPIGIVDDGLPARLRAGIEAGRDLIAAGFLPMVPHLWGAAAIDAFDWFTYQQWCALDMAQLRLCAAIVRIPGVSPGADREVAEAERLGLPVFASVGDVVVHFAHEAADIERRARERHGSGE